MTDNVTEILYGKDPDPNIVAVEPIFFKDHPTVNIYYRIDDKVQVDEQKFYPFFYVNDIHILDGFSRKLFKWKELKGDNHYKYLCVFDTYTGIKDALYFLKSKNKNTTDYLYRVSNYAEQYLIQSGKTLFKEMSFDDLHRLQFDIEVLSSGRAFPDARKKGDEIFMVSFWDNRGWKQVIHTNDMSEEELLKKTIKIIQDKNPDVIENHNIFKFDLPYIQTRCKRYNIKFNIGRDDSEMRSYPSSYRAAERTMDYDHYIVHGRHIIDTYFLVIQYDVYARALPSHSLKESAKFFGFAKDDREYVKGDQIANVWRKDPDRIIRYALDDVQEAHDLAKKLSGSNFYLTKMIPMSYQKLSSCGPTSKIQNLFTREYLKQRYSIRKPDSGKMTTGGLSKAIRQGIYGPVLYADVDSLYPSIMLNYNTVPHGDDLGVFQLALNYLTSHRFEVKTRRDVYDMSSQSWSELDAEQSSSKIFINAFFGGIGSAYFNFNDFAEADRVTQTGQKLLMQMVETIESKGGVIINLDTDGTLFVAPEDVYVGTDSTNHMMYGTKYRTTDIEFIKEISIEMPKGINIGFDGRYKKILCYKAKNYALKNFDGKIKYTGGSFKNRSNEPFGTRFIKGTIDFLLDDNIKGAHEYYNDVRSDIENKTIDINQLIKQSTLTKTLKEYKQAIISKSCNRAAAYELALNISKAGRNIDKGDRISYYVTGTKPNVTSFESCKLLDDYDKENPDENTSYYLNKLDSFGERFKPLLSPEDYRSVFSTPNVITDTTDYEEIKTVSIE